MRFEGVIPDLYQDKEVERQAETLQVFPYPASARGFSQLNLTLVGSMSSNIFD